MPLPVVSRLENAPISSSSIATFSRSTLRLLGTPWCLPLISTDASSIPLCRALCGTSVTYVFESGSAAIDFVGAQPSNFRADYQGHDHPRRLPSGGQDSKGSPEPG